MSNEIVENLNAQLEASKQMYNEALNNMFQLRTNNLLLQQKLHTLANELLEVKKSLESKPAIAEGEPNPAE